MVKSEIRGNVNFEIKVMLLVFPITLTGAAKRWKWHDESTSRRVSNDSSDGIAAITNNLDSLGRDMKKMKENVHANQVEYENYKGAYLNKEFPLNEEVHWDTTLVSIIAHPSVRKISIKELMNKHLDELTRRRSETEDSMKKLKKSTYLNTRNQNASLKNLETQIEQVAKEYKAKAANEVQDSSVGQCKAIFSNNEASTNEAYSKGTTELHGAPVRIVEKVLVKINKFLLPFDFMIIDMLDSLGRDMKKMKENVHANQVEYENYKRAYLNKEFPLNEEVKSVEEVKYRESGRPYQNNNGNGARYHVGRTFLVIIHARIDVFYKEISLRIGEDIIVFDMNGNVHHPVDFVEKVFVINEVQEEDSFKPPEIGNDFFSYNSSLCLEVKRINHMCENNQNNEDAFVCNNVQEQYEGEKGMTIMAESEIIALRLHYCKRLQIFICMYFVLDGNDKNSCFGGCRWQDLDA
nr:hypothetical protein [Tanacetum cinerariifolium]